MNINNSRRHEANMGKKGVAMCRLKKTEVNEGKAPKVRDRSKKDRPKTATELIAAIDAGRLDLRTGPAKRITALRAAIAAQPIEAAKGILKDCLAVSLAISQAVTAEISKPGFKVLQEDGSLNPLLSGPWAETQKSLIGTARLLVQVESNAQTQKPPTDAPEDLSGPVDVSALILEIDNEQGE